MMKETPEKNPCEGCPAHNVQNLIKLGITMDQFDYVVALAGNPNTGKSTVFNALTGLRQHTGNWPGKTVVRAEGGFAFGGQRFKIVDLPGTYSLLSMSTDEEIARDFLLFGQPDVTVIVVDATRLERNLNLVLQVLEITDRAIICLNLMDEAERHGLIIDERRLSRDLGIPVIPTTARGGLGIQDLLKAIAEVSAGTVKSRPYRIKETPKALGRAVERLTKRVRAEYPELPNARWVAMRLLEGDHRIVDALRSGELGSIAPMNGSMESTV
jgi:ferrous iron transport protein B